MGLIFMAWLQKQCDSKAKPHLDAEVVKKFIFLCF